MDKVTRACRSVARSNCRTEVHVNQENQSVKKTLALLVPVICLPLIPGAAKGGNFTLLGATSNPAGGSVDI
jgi:hypothetical protein